MNFFKPKTKILIYGSKGWIGGLFKKFLESKGVNFVEGLVRVDSDELYNEIKKVNPTNVISFIGRTHGKIDEIEIGTIDYLEYPDKLVENVRDNLYSPMNLSFVCKKLGVHYTYIGTGCIFDGLDNFKESDLPNYYGSSYSVVKGFTDRLVKNMGILNLRIRMPISSVPDNRNFITKITNYAKICSNENSMTVLDDFFPVILVLMKKRKIGTYNCTNPGTISHDTILAYYKNFVNPDFIWENFTNEEQNAILKSKRSNNKLCTTKIETEFPELKGIKESIIDILKTFKLNMSVDQA